MTENEFLNPFTAVGLDDESWSEIASGAMSQFEGNTKSIFGRMMIGLQLSVWNGDTKTFTKVGSVPAGVDRSSISTTMIVTIDQKEFSDRARQENWKASTWYVPVDGQDFEKHFAPSLIEVFGLTMSVKELREKLNRIVGEQVHAHYFEVQQVPQEPTKKQPESKYKTIEFVAKFDGRDAAYEAYCKRYKVVNDDVATEQPKDTTATETKELPIPNDWTREMFLSVVPSMQAQRDAGATPVQIAKDYAFDVIHVINWTKPKGE